MNNFELILLLLALASGITAVAKKIAIPYPIFLVFAGAVIGLAPIPGTVSLKDLVAKDEFFRFAIISIFLPSLLGEATLKLSVDHLKENKRPIIILSLVCTLLTYMSIGAGAHYLLGLAVPVAFVFAALMSATDPVSVLSIFKSLGVHKRLSILIEGESLFNDGIAYVLYTISSLYMTSYLQKGWVGLADGGLEFIKVVAGGIIIGAAFAYIFSQITRLFDDYPLEIIFSMILFYGSFFLAEHFEVSGVIAVVTSGLIYGSYGARIGMSPATRMNINSFWDVIALLANSMVFLMVGLVISRMNFSDKWPLIVGAIVLAVLSRAISVYISLLFNKQIPAKWKHVLNWGGLRGSLSIALALSLPPEFSERNEIILLTFCVVLFSLVFQGLTIKPFILWLGIQTKQEGYEKYEQTISRLHRSARALQRLQILKHEALITQVIYKQLADEYEQQLEQDTAALESLYIEYPALHEKELRLAREQALYSEHEAVEELRHKNIITSSVSEHEVRRIIEQLELSKSVTE